MFVVLEVVPFAHMHHSVICSVNWVDQWSEVVICSAAEILPPNLMMSDVKVISGSLSSYYGLLVCSGSQYYSVFEQLLGSQCSWFVLAPEILFEIFCAFFSVNHQNIKITYGYK